MAMIVFSFEGRLDLLTGMYDPGVLEADTAEQDDFADLPVPHRSRGSLVRRCGASRRCIGHPAHLIGSQSPPSATKCNGFLLASAIHNSIWEADADHWPS